MILSHTYWNKNGDDTKKPLGEVGFWNMLMWTQNEYTSHHPFNPAQSSWVKNPHCRTVGKNEWLTKGRNTVLNSLPNKTTMGFLSKEPKSSKALQKFLIGHVGTWFIQQTFVGYRSSNGLWRIRRMDPNIPSWGPWIAFAKRRVGSFSFLTFQMA